MKLVVFSDLDGTLLDHHTYSHAAADGAIADLLAAGGDLVLASSKTRAEMLPLWRELGLHSPFIVENGGGVYAPAGCRLAASDGWEPAGEGWLVHRLGMPVEQVRRRFAPFKSRVAGQSFSQMSDQRAAELTGLSLAQASLAKQREFNEPYYLEDPEREGARFFALADEAGLAATRGGRFFHLLGGGDKGRAVRFVRGLYRAAGESIVTMALGDAVNDLPMLQAVEHPVQVARHDGGYADLGDPAIARAGGIGPAGWSRAVAAFLEKNK